jgi:chromosome segregation protein
MLICLLNADLSANHEKIDSLEIQIKSTLETMAKETESKLKIEEILSNKENEVTDLSNKITELILSREEIEESLLDTQELVECMEKKLQDAYNEYKKETDRLTGDMESVNANMNDVKLERTKLIDINTDLSNQVSESLHAIANLQERESSLESRCKEYELQLEIEGEELDNNRTLISQLEQDVAGLQSELETCLSEIGAMEVERIQLKETLNVVLEQLEESKDQSRKTSSELKQSKTVGRELLVRVQELETQATNWESEVNKWKQRTCDRENEVSMVQHDLQLMQDKVRHLEQVGNNLEISLIEKDKSKNCPS